jgi:hypothetical protein
MVARKAAENFMMKERVDECVCGRRWRSKKYEDEEERSRSTMVTW